MTYVVLDDANGGIVRNLSHAGIGVQAVAALRLHQVVRVRFELRNPRLRIETQGEVVWSTATGQCGIRFLDLPPRMIRQVNEWIFGSLLESIPLHSTWRAHSMFSPIPGTVPPEANGGLILSPLPQKVIQLEPPVVPGYDPATAEEATEDLTAELSADRDWLSRPLSGRALAALVDGLVIIASVLLFALVFLSLAHELPKWPINLAVALGATVFVAALYWGFFQAFAGATPGATLATQTTIEEEKKEKEKEKDEADRFR